MVDEPTLLGVSLTADTSSDPSVTVTTPSANARVLVYVSLRRIGSAPVEPAVSGCGLSWSLVGSNRYVDPADEDGIGYATIFLFTARGPSPTAGPIAVDIGGITYSHVGVRVTQSANADAIVQSAGDGVGVNGPLVIGISTLTDQTNNAIIVYAVGFGATARTWGLSGTDDWDQTELVDESWADAGSVDMFHAIHYEIGNANTDPSLAMTLSGNMGACGGIAIELAEAAGGGGPVSEDGGGSAPGSPQAMRAVPARQNVTVYSRRAA